MKDKTTLQLAQRLNEILKLTQGIELEQIRMDHDLAALDKEWNDICYELWDRIPSLKEDLDLRPKTRVRRPGKENTDV